MKNILLAIASLIVFHGQAFAGSSQPDMVVELFTSQGCSSCPPANDFVSSISEEPDILTLSYGVHYWDYLGWKDTFAKPKFTKRQRSYGEAFDAGNIYTPQIVLNGSAHSPRYSRADVQSMPLAKDRPQLDLYPESGTLVARRSASQNMEYDVHLVEYVPGPQSVKVDAGENHGRILKLTNVVTDVKSLGLWRLAANPVLDTGVSPEDGKSYALLFHEPKSHKIHSAVTFARE